MKSEKFDLKEIVQEGSLMASKALSKMTGREVLLEVLEVKIMKLKEMPPLLPPEEAAVGVFLPISSELHACSLLIYLKRSALQLVDLLIKQPPGNSNTFSPLGESALKEMGNILVGNFLTVLGNALQVRLIGGLPQLGYDHFGKILQEVVTNYVPKAEEAVVIQLGMIMKPLKIEVYLLMVFELDELQTTLKKGGGIGDL